MSESKVERPTVHQSSVHQFSADHPREGQVSLDRYQGKALLIVNTASKCGLTPQYEGLEALYQKYKDKGLEILGFPCDQFAHQEPGADEEIAQFCQLNFGVSFPLFRKIAVNGKGAHPLFRFLRKKKPGLLGDKIPWNFTKFLVDAQGRPVKRFAPTAQPASLEPHIQKLLGLSLGPESK